jgi:soluble lytic murein transglycosylase
MQRWCDLNGKRPFDEFVELVTYEQTREYIKRVSSIYAHYRYLYDGKPWVPPMALDCRPEKTGPDF